MLRGHGDDAYRYSGIRHNFSSNIYAHACLDGLKLFLATRLDGIAAYPEPEPEALEALIAEREGVGRECLLVTSGATEAIYLIAQMARAGGLQHFVCQQPTFSEYADASRLNGLLPAGEGEAEQALRWLCNPNNPTGHVLPPQEVLRLAARSRLTVLDQSYEDYTAEPLPTAGDVLSAGNILRLHSLTKTYAVPGLRIGYVLGAPGLISRLRRFLRPWSVNALAIEAAQWLICHEARAVGDIGAYLAEARRLRERLSEIPGLSVAPTQTNFMLVRIETLTAARLKECLAKGYGILIRDASNFEGLGPHHFRVAAQTPREDDLLVAAIRECLQGEGRPSAPAGDEPARQGLRPVMLAGTGSDVGKSVLAAALCRIFRQDGYHPAPFKAQNMALNSYATPEGLEIGRAQAMQAEAAGIPCHTDMNPLLLKPQGDMTSQVVLNGCPIGNRSAYQYWRREAGEGEGCPSGSPDSPGHSSQSDLSSPSSQPSSSSLSSQSSPSSQYSPSSLSSPSSPSSQIDFRAEVCAAYDRLSARYNPIVMEGAGSISELNLRHTDLVNLPMARHAGAAVLLVADIDRGGVFASVYGSIALQTPQDRALIKGIIINKFRGDLRLFESGRRLLEELCGVPVLGVIPYFQDIRIEEEDSVALDRRVRQSHPSAPGDEAGENTVKVAVVKLRHLSNYTDFDALDEDPRIRLYYTQEPGELQKGDIIILPGSKSTLDDLLWLRQSGLAEAILEARRQGKTVIGICGGYQMMGAEVCDPNHVEGPTERLPGLGLLPVTTTMSGRKVTRQTTFQTPLAAKGTQPLRGYEIHMGQTRPLEGTAPSPFALLDDGRQDGYLRDERCWGSYLHGVLDNGAVIDALLSPFAARLEAASRPLDYAAFKEEQYDRLARHVRKYLDVERLYEILKMPCP
ncbi:MAG: cobyric acid synthase [Bacteroidaceae bacterium]|nr:cobyric acid synthase [Bacteroidaceae bacterium]